MFGIWFAVGLVGFIFHGGYTCADSLYLMAPIITTVGYGDFGIGFEGPSTTTGYIFMTFYILMSVMVLASLAGAALGAIVEQADALQKNRFHDMLVAAAGAEGEGSVRTTRDFSHFTLDANKQKGCCAMCLGAYVKYGQEHEEFRPFVRSAIVWTVIVVIGVVFFCNYPGEDLSVVEGIYMCVVTLSTVGFGDFHPQTQGGKMFAAAWMLVGCAALADMVSKFSIAFVDSKKHGLDH